MAVEEKHARVVLGAVCAALLGLGVATDLPRVTGGEFWGDGATYTAMALSLAFDGDVRWTAGDLERIRREYPGGRRDSS